LIGFCAIPFSPMCSWLWAKLAGCYDLLSDRERVHDMVHASGWAGPLILVGLHVTQVLLAPIPGDAFCILGGYLFGTINGFLLSTLGMTIGSIINFYVGRLLGDRVVRRLVSENTYSKFDALVQKKKMLFIFLLFLIPGSPKDMLCMLLGLTSMPVRVFIVLSMVARMPTTAAFSMQGAAFFGRDYAVFVTLLVLCVVFATIAYISRGSIIRWMDKEYP